MKKILRYLAFRYGLFKRIYLKICKPNGAEYALYLKKWGGFRSIGDNCSILPSANLTDPYLTYIGSNVRLSKCDIFGHDGSVNMLAVAYNIKLDKVGPVKLFDNVFVGHGAIILPGVSIGPNAIVAAGAVVAKSVPEGAIVAGNPAKPIGTVADLVERTAAQNKLLPWHYLIEKRTGGFDIKLEPEINKIRVDHFFNRQKND